MSATSKLFRSAVTVLIAAAAVSCAGRKSARHCAGSIWATTYNITYTSDRQLDDSILSVLHAVESSLSPFAHESLISRINRNESFDTDSMLRRVFLTSQHINRLSHGAFDPTMAPLVNLWGFGYKNSGIEPTQAMIDSAMVHVGITGCRIAGGRMEKISPATEFNFSAITKGFACDMVGEMLRRNGCEDYMVEIGGEIALSGKNPQGDSWHIQIDAPDENNGIPTHKSLTVIRITDCGIATSGNYRNYRESASGKSWHTIDPATGRPAVTPTLSATVIAPDCMTADALATACMVMPADSAIAMIESLPEVSALLVSADSTGFISRRTSRFP